MRERTKVFGFAAVALLVMQALPVDRSDKPVNGPIEIGDPVVGEIVERACVDCHTNHTTWPWYAKVAPLSWWIAHHVEEGREHLNLSEWAALDAREQDHKLEEVVEHVEEREMPLPSYTWLHAEARLTDEERQTVIAWAKAMRAELGVSSGEGEMEHAEEEGESEGERAEEIREGSEGGDEYSDGGV